ncbi:MAG: sulfurtransferase TusA family protein [Gammaproteobacteria bacterium]|nr:sulfurtransferase TusA family protein [Gammaproteobacteria bacterium]
MSSGTEADIEVDARNLLCPMPVIRCGGAADGQPPGTRIRVIATDPGALSDIPARAASTATPCSRPATRRPDRGGGGGGRRR